MSNPKNITISIVDDQADLREQIAGYMNASPGICCLHAYADSSEALAKLPRQPTDVVLMDINLGDHSLDGIECVRQLKLLLPATQIIMLTVFEDTEKIFKALASGASGYLLKRMPPQQLLEAIHEVMSGGSPMSAPIARKVVQSFQSGTGANTGAELSPREHEVLVALSEGLAYKQIAGQLDVSIHTVRNYIRRIYEKLHVQSRTEAVAKFLKR